jgi:hypothetical protein
MRTGWMGTMLAERAGARADGVCEVHGGLEEEQAQRLIGGA